MTVTPPFLDHPYLPYHIHYYVPSSHVLHVHLLDLHSTHTQPRTPSFTRICRRPRVFKKLHFACKDLGRAINNAALTSFSACAPTTATAITTSTAASSPQRTHMHRRSTIRRSRRRTDPPYHYPGPTASFLKAHIRMATEQDAALDIPVQLYPNVVTGQQKQQQHQFPFWRH